uniref:NADH-ubiquinone oxidoreductase chain 3 n=1 Tax=Phrynus sp. 1 SEM-2008 TaxID=507471 RepID=B2CKD9_9ARAC|nr:NADH dehydrogenase subunit 3 [Phrynus sp. 1 SEM-2008]
MLLTSYLIFLILLLMVILLLIINLFMSSKPLPSETPTPFECGFDPHSTSRIPFSLQFFLIAILFLIFDVEISLILPFIFCFSINPSSHLSFMIFLMILLLGLFYEWYLGSLNWLN